MIAELIGDARAAAGAGEGMQAGKALKLLALCGSLRQQSRCRVLLEALALSAFADFRLAIYPDLGALPWFNPDLESLPPQGVAEFWRAAGEADGVVIASPEYAHGVSGTLKNALDWLVGYEPFAYKPVVVLNPSHRANHADEALKEILRTMVAQLIDDACLRIPVTATTLNARA